MEDRDQLVTLLDEQGREVVFDLVVTFDYDGRRYAALLPVDDVDGVGDDEVVLLEVVREDGGEVYRTIDNEILLDEVFREFLELFDEIVEGGDD